MTDAQRIDALCAKLAALRDMVGAMSTRVEFDLGTNVEDILTGACKVLGASMACLHLEDAESGVLNLVSGYKLHPVWARAWSRLKVRGSAFPARVHHGGRPVSLLGDDAPRGLNGVAAAPISSFELHMGTISLLWADEDRMGPDPDREVFLTIVGYLLAVAVEHMGLVSEMVDNLTSIMELRDQEEAKSRQLAELNEELTKVNQRLAELSITDGLTGTYNHRYLHQRLHQEIDRALRQEYPLSLIMADLDHFKRLNDNLGHQAGDDALRDFADWLKQGVRKVDMVGRYGGEEFVVVLIDCDRESAMKVADKLRETTEQLSLRPPFDRLGGFTVSMGVAQFAPDMGADDLIAAADRALYAAKRAGRNRVRAAA